MTRNRAGSAALPGSAALRCNRGFTLVEAMVALIVLSVGLLGIAALYVETLRANRTSLYRTQAVNMATDIGDRMRSNRNPAAAYACGSPCDPTAGGSAIEADRASEGAATANRRASSRRRLVYFQASSRAPGKPSSAKRAKAARRRSGWPGSAGRNDSKACRNCSTTGLPAVSLMRRSQPA